MRGIGNAFLVSFLWHIMVLMVCLGIKKSPPKLAQGGVTIYRDTSFSAGVAGAALRVSS